MKKKRIRFSLCILSCCMMLLGCTKTKEIKDKEIKKDVPYYLSFNVARLTKEESLCIDVYTYDPTKEKVSKKAEISYIAQYPLAVYSQKKDAIYYTTRVGDSHLDNLNIYDVKTKKSKRLTETIFAVNYIIPNQEHVYMAAVTTNSESSTLQLYDYTQQKLNIDKHDTDFCVWKMALNPNNGSLLMGGFSDKEDRKRVDNQDKEEYVHPKNTVFIKDGDKWEKLFDTLEGELSTLCFTDTDTILYIFNNELYEGTVDKQVVLKGYESLEINELIYKDKNLLYYVNENGELCAYDDVKKEKKVLFHSDINADRLINAVVLRK